jgi:hypothetical protein
MGLLVYATAEKRADIEWRDNWVTFLDGVFEAAMVFENGPLSTECRKRILGFRLLRIEPQYIKKEGTYYDL